MWPLTIRLLFLVHLIQVAHCLNCMEALQSYTTNAITVIPGDLPLLLTVPHGGLAMPTSIPNRTEGQVIPDAYTIVLAKYISQQIRGHYKARPYMLILNVARRKVDVNRPIDQGTDSETGQQVWAEYHDALRGLVQQIQTRFGEGLLLDIHGQAHREGMVELGYMVQKSKLQTVDRDQDLITNSSLSRLAHRLLQNNRPEVVSQLLRGSGSFGDKMMGGSDLIQVVPSPTHRSPAKQALYFEGGYTTQQYSSQLDVIQIESPQALRFSASDRPILAQAIANATTYFMDKYYSPLLARL
ncbi:hypothetical protein DM01DRAFT_1337108, partial [Hesseltinella vesiculosa]